MSLKNTLITTTILFLLGSCSHQKQSENAIKEEKNEHVILVNTKDYDSLYHLYDSVSKLWHKSRKELNRLDHLLNTKAAYGDDFYFNYESSMQYVFELAKELNGLDSICTTVGIFTFNYKIYKTSEKAIESIDSVLNNKSLNLTAQQKEVFYKDRERLSAVRNKVFKRTKG